MKITLFPSLAGKPIEAIVKGDVITINGTELDFSVIPEGYSLPRSAVDNEHFVAQIPVTRINGELSFGLVMQVFPLTDEKWRDPVKPNVLNVKSGNVVFPDVSEPIPEASDFEPPVSQENETNHDRPEPVGENQDS